MYKTTIDQWLLFKTVAEQGGFSAASRVLNRSQSTISYAVNKLEKQLNVKLFRIDGKMLSITPAGQNLLQRLYPILSDFSNLEQTASYLADGVEANLTVVVDAIFPKDLLFDVLSQFNHRYPQTHIELKEYIRFLPSDEVDYDLAISVAEDGLIPGPKLLEFELVPVAHKDHPVFENPGKCFSSEELQAYKQLLLQSGLKPQMETKPYLSRNVWAVSSIESALAAVRANICIGWLPHHVVANDIKRDEVKIIPLAQARYSLVPLYLVGHLRSQYGPAAKYLRELLITTCNQNNP